MALTRGRGRSGGGLRRDRGRGRPRRSYGYSRKYSQRGRAAQARARRSKGRSKRYRPHPMAGRGRQPHSGYKGGKVYRVVKGGPRPTPKRTGRTTTNSRYSAPKPATSTKKATTTTASKNIPKPTPQKARSAGYFDVLGHYRVQETINSDRFSAPGTIDMNPVPPISDTPTDGEYGDFFDDTYPADSLEIDIGLTNQEFDDLWVWTEKYDVNGNVYFDGQADIQIAGDYARLEIRIVEGP